MGSAGTARRERRRTARQRIIHRRGSQALLPGLRRSLERVLPRLARQGAATEVEFQRLLRWLDPERSEFDVLAGLSLPALTRRLRSRREAAFVESVRRQGRALAARTVPEPDAVGALALSLESCLASLLSPGERSGILSLVRLAGIAQRLVLAGYAEGSRDGWRRLEERERLTLSRDLHDEVGGDLVVLKLYLEMTAIELAKGAVASAGPKLQEALALVGHVIESVRRLTLDLGPAVLEQIGFLPALRIYTRKLSARTGIVIRVSEGDVPERLPTGYEAALYRVLQGALSNVVKHAQARSVSVSLGTVRGQVLVMIIEDDGVGFDLEHRPSSQAFGLTAMRERIRNLGGRLHVESRTAGRSPGRSGTRIEIDLPLRETEPR